jgi:hypothetical protein
VRGERWAPRRRARLDREGIEMASDDGVKRLAGWKFDSVGPDACEITLRFEDLPSEKIAIPYEKLDDLIGGLEQIRRALNSFG